MPSSQALYIVAIALLCLVIIIVLLVGLSASSSSCSLRERSMEVEEGASVVGGGGGGKIKVGVCVMEKKVKCGSEVLFSLIFFFLLLLDRCFLLLTNSLGSLYVFFFLSPLGFTMRSSPSVIYSSLWVYRSSQVPWGKFWTDWSRLVNLR